MGRVLLAIRVDGGEGDAGGHLGEMHLGSFALGHGTHARVADATGSASSHQDGFLEATVNLNVNALEAANDAFAVAEEPSLRVGRCAGAASGTSVTGVVGIVVEPSKDDDFFASHEHEVLWFCGRVVDESSARTDAALLEGEAGPCIERVCVHDNEV